MEGEERRDRLARLQLERMSRPPKRGWRAGLNHLSDRWHRFMAASGWEKVFFAGAILFIAGLAIGGFFMLTTNVFGGAGGKKNVAADAPHATSTPQAALPTPTAIVIGVPVLPTAKPTDRSNCAQLAGTTYDSDTERLFFEQNCVTPTAQPTGTAAPPPPTQNRGPASPTQPRPTSPPLPTQPPPPPPPPPGFTASDAINVGVYWMTHTGGYSVDTGTCNAFDTGGHWVVTCGVSSNGGGQTSLSVCVFADPLRVLSSDQC